MALFNLGGSAAATSFSTDWDAVFRERLRRQRAALARGGTVGPDSGAGRQPSSPGATIASQGSISGQAQPRSVTDAQRVAAQGSVSGNAQPRSAPGISSGAGGVTASGVSAVSEDSARGVSGEPSRDPVDNRYNYPGGLEVGIDPSRDWYGNGQLPQASVLELANNPAAWNTRYAQSQGFGPGVENLLDRWMDPGAAYLLSLGQGEGGDADPLAKLDFVGGMLDSAMSRDLSGGLGGGLRPRDIVQQVFGASGNPGEGSPIGQMLYGGGNAGNWGAQVDQTIQFLEAALYGRLTPEVLGPYLQILQREGELFLDWKMRNPQLPGNFGQWILDRLGPNAGL